MQSKRFVPAWCAAAVAAVLAGCAANPAPELEDVAKDWSLTIRASQVIPVYPLSQDLQPGDVFLVPKSMSEQVKLYREEGFLPLDQLVTRLSAVDFQTFYAESKWRTDCPEPPGETLCLDLGDGARIAMARTAFPSYEFDVSRSGGLRLALPIEGIPVGLGLLGATEARGSVNLSNAYSYGVDSESLYRRLHAWYSGDSNRARVLTRVSKGAGLDVYLRVVTRVFLVKKIEASLVATKGGAFGADVGLAQSIPFPDLSGKTAEDSAKAVDQFVETHKVLQRYLGEAFNTGGLATPGGLARFATLGGRSIEWREELEHPLVFGYQGFDVRVTDQGLSVPIPSFAVLRGDFRDNSLEAADVRKLNWCDRETELADRYRDWLKIAGNHDRMLDWLQTEIGTGFRPADIRADCAFRPLLNKAAQRFDDFRT